uniref:Uncharacterized protein n=1 Tax=Pithovirus LCDPAC01 TaxID=2506600 RepID=A0A481YMJ1_9VIRU|nr:MAG: hypothetical protein LCDPAC01_00810 [Pithovirus LCDPAC01]
MTDKKKVSVMLLSEQISYHVNKWYAAKSLRAQNKGNPRTLIEKLQKKLGYANIVTVNLYKYLHWTVGRKTARSIVHEKKHKKERLGPVFLSHMAFFLKIASGRKPDSRMKDTQKEIYDIVSKIGKNKYVCKVTDQGVELLDRFIIGTYTKRDLKEFNTRVIFDVQERNNM